MNNFRVEWFCNGLGIYIAKQNKEITAFTVAYEKSEVIEINELMSNNEESRASIIKALSTDFPTKKIMRNAPSSNVIPQHPLGMARIIDASTFLQDYATVFPEKELKIKLIDKQIACNNNYYHLTNGTCTASNIPIDTTFEEISINELCKQLLTPLHSYMNLMLN